MELPNKVHDDRPWGSFDQFTSNEQTTVKILRVNKGGILSLQYHNHRDEFWHVIRGHGTVVIGEIHHDAKEGDEFFIRKGEKHRIIGDPDNIELLEIAFGEFDEDDIVRLEDTYGRT